MDKTFTIKLTDDELVNVRIVQSYAFIHDIIALHDTEETDADQFIRPDGAGDIEWRPLIAGDLPEHDLGGDEHGADTLANLNSKVSDATLDDENDTRDPNEHDIESLHSTTEMETDQLLRPDGAGGVEWGEPAEVEEHDIAGDRHNRIFIQDEEPNIDAGWIDRTALWFETDEGE